MSSKFNFDIRSEKICLWPPLSGVGGPASFYQKMKAGIENRGLKMADDPEDPLCKTVLVIGGSAQLDKLWRARHSGKKIFQRLNGMNWVHRRRFTGVNHFLRSERNNFLLATIRRFLADGVIYQSQFSKTWWHSVYGGTHSPDTVVYNGVDLEQYIPLNLKESQDGLIRLLIIEGHLGGGHQYGLDIAHHLGLGLQNRLNRPVEIRIVGDVPEPDRLKWSRVSDIQMQFLGVVPRHDIRGLNHTSHLMYTTELNAACPNSVIEAMACGLPVIGYRTGSIYELLGDEGGVCVPYGSDHWKLEKPDIGNLVAAGVQVLQALPQYRLSARKRAEELFDVNRMVDLYLGFMLG